MKKIFTLFAALTMVLSMFAAAETVYFVNASSWTGTINAYAWTDGGANNQSWPGVAAAKEAEQIAGYDVYSYTAEAGAYAKVIFNNGSAQTADLKWTAGKYYCKDGWYTKEEAAVKLGQPIEYESVYFVDNQGWGKANIYTWTPEVGTWPGVAMTKEAEQLAGHDVYSYTVEKGTSFGGVIFNNGSSQTSNLVWTAGKYYVKDGWYTKEEAVEKLSGPVAPPVISYVLMGVAGDWTTGIALTANPDNANEYVLLDQTISEGDAVKVVTLTDGAKTAYCGNVDEYSVEHSADKDGNIVLAPGTYDFYYKVAEDLIYIGAAEPSEPEIEWMEMPLEISNLTTMEMPVDDVTYLRLMGRNDMDDADVMLFLNNYTGEEKAYEVNAESSYMTFGGLELTVMDGSITKSVDPELGDVYAGVVHASVYDDMMGGTMYLALNLTMYALSVEPVEVVVENATVVIEERSMGFGDATYSVLILTGEWSDGETTYPVSLETSEFDPEQESQEVAATLTVGGWGDEDPWLGFGEGNATIAIVDNTVSVSGLFENQDTGFAANATISGTLPADEPEVIAYELNGGELPAPAVPTNEELWIAFMPYYQEYYDVVRAEQPIASVAVFLSAGMGDDATIFTSEDSDYKWLGDYIIKVTTEQSAALTTLANWKFNAQAFFNANQYTGWPKSADFTEAGKPENWGAAYEAAHAVVLPTEPVAEDYVLPTPVKTGYTFVGWYDNAEGTGEAYTVIPAGWSGTLYAIWKQDPTTALENIAVEGKAVKAIINGQLIIIKNGVQYNAQGAVVK